MTTQHQMALGQSRTMSSIEISRLTDKEHKNVIADIRQQILIGLYDFSREKMAKISAIKEIQGVTVILDNRNYWSEVKLDRYHTDILVSGYEVKYRAAIVKRWHELEQQQAQFSIPKTLSEALLLAGKIAEEKEMALAKIEADAPKVKFAEAVRNLDGTCSVEQLAKVLGFGRNNFYDALRNAGYLMKNNQPYQLYINHGLFVYVEKGTWLDPQGRSHPRFETRITGKGQVAIEKFFRK